MTPIEALARIAALEAHDPDDRGGDTYDVEEVRAILAEVTPAGVTLTPEEAGIAARGIREWLHQLDRYSPTLYYGPAAFRDNASALADRLEKVAGR